MQTKSTTHANDNLLFVFFLLILAWIPIPLGSNRPASESLMHIALGLASGWWLLFYLTNRVIPSQAFRAALPVLIPLGLIAGWQWLQSLALPADFANSLHTTLGQTIPRGADITSISLSPWDSGRAAMNTLAYLQVFSLMLLLIDRVERLRTLIMVLVISGTFQAAYGAFMVMSGTEYLLFSPKEFYRGVATGTFVNRNHLAGYLELCLAMGIGLLLADLRLTPARNFREGLRNFLNTLLSPKAQLRLLLAVMVIGLVMTRSRMGNTSFFVSLTVMALVYFAATRAFTRAGVLLFASLLLVDVLIVGNFFGFEEVVDRLQSTSALTEERPIVAADTLKMIKDYPFTGIGAGAYHAVYPGYQSMEVGGYYDHAHNDYLEFAAELGIPMTLLLGLAVLASIVTAIKTMSTRRNPLARGVAAGAFMGLLSLLIHAAVDFNFYIPSNAATFMVVLALPWVTMHLKRRQR